MQHQTHKKKRHFFKKRITWIVLGSVALISGVVLAANGGDADQYETVRAAKGTVLETVTATGQIRPDVSASLRFKIGGVISELRASVGDAVKKGDLLAKLEASDLQKRLIQAQAETSAAEVSVANKERNVNDTNRRNTQNINARYSDAIVGLGDILNAAQKAHATYLSFFDGQGKLITNAPTLTLLIEANAQRPAALQAFSSLNALIGNYNPAATQAEVDATLLAIHAPLQQMNSAMTALIFAINSIATGAIEEDTIDTYKSSLATAQANLNTAISLENTLKKDIRDQIITNELNANSARAEYDTALASLKTAQAALEIARRNVEDAYLYAPIDGIVATKDKQIGEAATTADQIYFILNNEALEVVSNIPEVDVSRIALSAKVTGTLDAFGPEEEFSLSVTRIDPDQTTVDGVVYYKTHFVFDNFDERFKSGMSVNLTIVTRERENVLTVPRRAITEKAGKASVRVLVNGAVVEKEVKLGLKGDTDVEVASGLTEGEEVVVSTTVKK